VAAPTPFLADGSCEPDAMRANVNRWYRAGVDGVLVLGTTGEALHLEDDEAIDLIHAAREATPPSGTLLVGTARPTTAATIRWTNRAAEAGAQFALVLTPFYYRAELSWAAMTRYFREVAEASPIPVILYAMPARTGVVLPPSLVGDLSEHPRIFGVKDSSGDATAIFEQVSLAAEGFRVFNGSARAIYPGLACGASGSVLALAAVAPELAVAVHREFAAGRRDAARELASRLAGLSRQLAPFGLGGLKAAMSLRGYRGGLPRAPLAFDPATVPNIKAALDACLDVERNERGR
jgi:4-hydroxy-2-oxoglutarate aldolase